jgi:cell division septation protein DedD
VRDGINAWQKGDFTTAVDAWKPLAAAGNADAAFNLGQAYRLGKGVGIDLARAQALFEQAARKGHIDAATNLGIMLFQSNNRTGAMRWLRQAAEGSEPRAMLLYGTALFNGDGVKPDPIRAYAYVSRAAAQGLEPAKATLADLDEVMPIEQRQAGVKLAQAMLASSATAAPAPAPNVVAKPPTAPPRPVPAAKTPVIAKVTPPARASSPAKPPVAASGGWRVQLGAFSSRGSAQSLYGKLSGKLGGAQAYYVPVGNMTRLQAGPFASRAAATGMCAKLKPQACFPVPGR